MSRRRIRRSADDEAWLAQVNAALSALDSVYQSLSRENGLADRLTRQMRCLKQVRTAWLAGERARASQLFAAALKPGGPPPAPGSPRQ
jgi:hypothetical protein